MDDKYKERNIKRFKEFVYPDSYAYVIRSKKTGKILISEWSEKDAENQLKKIRSN